MTSTYEDLLELGEFYIISQKFEEAIKVLKKAQKINDRNAKLYYDFGIAYEALNERDKAISSFRVALSLDPNFKSVQEHLEKLIEEKR